MTACGSWVPTAAARATHSKRTWAGAEERRTILAGQDLVLEGPMLPGGAMAGVDDVLDAAIVAWSARRLAAGTGQSFPARPDQFSPGGRPIAIWA